ncbi:hypothetical protein KJ903_05130 [Patescibacteria group bacterium]|nr:hypothetical protein [Patescibacteria group bacterium]
MKSFSCLGLFLVVTFGLIPSLLVGKGDAIKFVQREAGIKLERQDELEYNDEDWLGFDYGKYIQVKFSEERYNEIVDQIEDGAYVSPDVVEFAYCSKPEYSGNYCSVEIKAGSKKDIIALATEKDTKGVWFKIDEGYGFSGYFSVANFEKEVNGDESNQDESGSHDFIEDCHSNMILTESARQLVIEYICT